LFLLNKIQTGLFVLESNRDDLFEFDNVGPAGNLMIESKIGSGITERILESTIARLKRNFVAVVVERRFGGNWSSHQFKASVILISPIGTSLKSNNLFGNPAPSSYVPNVFSSFYKHMTFWQRLENFFINSHLELLREIFYMPKQRKFFDKYFQNLNKKCYGRMNFMYHSYQKMYKFQTGFRNATF
jgi:hypothetical protein